jgi:sensor histidine kinase YesM
MRKSLLFQTKLFLANLLIFILLFSIFVLYFFFFVIQAEKEKGKNNLTTVSSQIAEQVDSLVYNMDHLSLLIASNPYVIRSFNKLPTDRGINYFNENFAAAQDLIQFINSYNFKKGLAFRICLYNTYHDFVYSGIMPTSETKVRSFFQSSVFNTIANHFSGGEDRYKLFIPIRPDPFYDASVNRTEEYLVSIVREIKDYTMPSVDENYGYVELQQPVFRIAAFFESLDVSVTGFLVDAATGEIMYSSKAGRQYPAMVSRFSDDGTYEVRNTIITHRSLQQIPYYLVLTQPVSEITSAAFPFLLLFFIVSILVTLVLMVSEFIIIKKITSPLVALRKSIAEVNLHNMSLQLIDDKNSDEIGRLNYAFQSMFKKLKESIDDLLISKTSELNSYLLALQAQLNPHFLHNTLSLISISAQDGQYQKIVEICKILSAMLRYSIDYEDSICTLENELQHTINYLELMKYRYEGHFQFEIDVDPTLIQQQVPRLLLQPLVENSFAHGFKQKSPPWFISIRAYTKGQVWYLEVEDNGGGFNEDYLVSFMRFCSDFTSDKILEKIHGFKMKGMFLENTYIRLKLFYGVEIFFDIGNCEEGGSVIAIGGMKYDTGTAD